MKDFETNITSNKEAVLIEFKLLLTPNGLITETRSVDPNDLAELAKTEDWDEANILSRVVNFLDKELAILEQDADLLIREL